MNRSTKAQEDQLREINVPDARLQSSWHTPYTESQENYSQGELPEDNPTYSIYEETADTDAPTNDVNPKRIWDGLTFFVRVFTLATVMSVGGCLASSMVPPDRLVPYDYEESRREADFAYRFMVGRDGPKKVFGTDDPVWLEQWREERFQEFLSTRRWETRNKVQSTSAKFFWLSLVLIGIFHWMRKEPSAFDNTLSGLPKVISHRIQYFIARWRVSVLDKNGNELRKEFYRTAAKATKAAERLAQTGAQVRVAEDHSGYYAYEQFTSAKKEVASIGYKLGVLVLVALIVPFAIIFDGIPLLWEKLREKWKGT